MIIDADAHAEESEAIFRLDVINDAHRWNKTDER
jgi:hypothetical protein